MQKQQIAIYGVGGFGREVAWLVESCNENGSEYDIVCFVDDNKSHHGREINNILVMGLEELTKTFPHVRIVGGVGAPKTRQLLMERAISKGLEYQTIVHPRVERSRWVEIGAGTIICAGSILTTNITLGEQVQINIDCTLGHDVFMDDYTTLAPGVHVSGYVHFGKRVYVGTGAVIINGTQGNPILIGDDAVIGAGACVTKSVPAGTTVVGVPAKPLPSR